MRIMKALAALAALLVPLLGAAPAGAATPGCRDVTGGVCHSWQTPAAGGLDLDVFQARATPDTPLIVFNATSTDRAEDLITVPVANGLPDVYGVTNTAPATGTLVELEYAPDGIQSGECVSVLDPVAGQADELRPCDTVTSTYNPYQTFIEAAAAGDGSFVTFEDISATVPTEAAPAVGLNLYLTDPRNAGIGKIGRRTRVESLPEFGGAFAEGQLWADAA